VFSEINLTNYIYVYVHMQIRDARFLFFYTTPKTGICIYQMDTIHMYIPNDHKNVINYNKWS
jgi:hypothetical protein